jgi:outer membrane protein OmpA-like peptidoglycan-associated protein
VKANVAGARVEVDKKPAGETPVALRDLPAGPHQVVVVADGYQAHVETVEVEPGRVRKLTVVLAIEKPERAVATVGDSNQINLPARIEFDARSSRIKPAARAMLAQVAQVLAGASGLRYRIEGFDDSSSGASAGDAISWERAEEVRTLLIANGVDPTRLTVVGRGVRAPIADNRTAEGRARNRRVEIWIAD